MRPAVLACLILMSGTASAAERGQSLDAAPDWVRKPTSQDMSAAWPYDAYRRGLSGDATISCLVTPAGTLEDCEVVTESPAGEGFGAAALSLAPSFALKPGRRDGQAVRSAVQIPIRFQMAAGGVPDNAARARTVVESHWARAPSYADVLAAWPAGVDAETGHVSLRCKVSRLGALRECSTLSETPRGQGFGKAAHKLAAGFQMRILPEQARELSGAYVNVPVHFTNPARPIPRAVTNPRWLKSIDPEKVVAIYPEAAIAAGVRSGKGVADCAVGPDGSLVDCKPAPATPPGLGFSEAAAKIASVLQMNPWSDGGMPLDGLRLRLPVTFNLAQEQPSP